MTIHAIPTRYNGINFRSRLEAKYACIFEQLGWNWEYEPVDYRGWIPDFVIKGYKPLYVEVKPIFEFDPALGEEVTRALSLTDEHGWMDAPHHALICGACLPENQFGEPGLGWLWDLDWSPSHVFELMGRGVKGFGICHDTNWYGDRITGISDGDHHMGNAVDLEAMWR